MPFCKASLVHKDGFFFDSLLMDDTGVGYKQFMSWLNKAKVYSLFEESCFQFLV